MKRRHLRRVNIRENLQYNKYFKNLSVFISWVFPKEAQIHGKLISRPITRSPIQLDNTELKPNDQVEAYEETGEFPPDVEFVELQTDVGWYGRQCRKRLRDQVISCKMLLAILLLEMQFPFIRVPHV